MTGKYNPFYRTKPKMIYIPDHWGRLGQGKWVENDNFSPPPKRGSKEHLDARNLFHITTSIGDQGTNNRTDVGKLEALLYMAGVYDLDPTGGPTGYYGERLKLAAKDFQKSHALTVDGNVNPGGKTFRALARRLQNMGRRGDTVLAHLTPEEARFLHENTDGGSINPQTGLIEFYDAGKKKGSYIWRTVGDAKVRSSHTERDGKVFSWDDPPEGGHPGEAYNCRCSAEERDCIIQRLDLEKIVDKLTPLSARLGDLKEYEIPNLKIKIEVNEANIKYLEKIETALLAGAAATKFPNPFVKIAGYASEVAAVMVANKIREFKAELKANTAKLGKFEKERSNLERKIKSLKYRKNIAQQAYDECTGK